MDDLKTMLDKKMSIADIKDSINQYLSSANDCPDKLSLTIVMLYLIQEGSKLLQTVDPKDFISQVVERINELEKQKNSLEEEYNAHLTQNNVLIDVLRNNDNSQVVKMQKQIQDTLKAYDGIIATLVEERERLSVEQQIAVENHNGANA